MHLGVLVKAVALMRWVKWKLVLGENQSLKFTVAFGLPTPLPLLINSPLTSFPAPANASWDLFKARFYLSLRDAI